MDDKHAAQKVNKSQSAANGKIFSKQSAAIIAAVILIAAYVAFECYSAANVGIETYTAQKSTVYQSISAQAVAVRDEHTISNESTGVIVAAAADGEKVKKGGVAAYIFNSSESAQSYSKKAELENKLNYYLSMAGQSNGTATDIKSIDKEIASDVNDYIRASAAGDMIKTKSAVYSLNSTLTGRQLIIGEDIDFTSITDDIQSQINSISADCEPIGTVNADSSGVFASAADGCEDIFDYNNIMTVSQDTLNDYIESAQKVQKNKKGSSHLGKLITSYAWYFCCTVDADKARNIKNGETLEVSVSDSDKILECTVMSGAEPEPGAESTVLVLKCADVDSETVTYRLENIEIRYDVHDGIKVPESSVHVVDGKKGVYVLVSNQIKFRQAEMLYAQGGYVWFDSSEQSKDGIRLYDQVITKGKDLYDGKVYN